MSDRAGMSADDEPPMWLCRECGADWPWQNDLCALCFYKEEVTNG